MKKLTAFLLLFSLLFTAGCSAGITTDDENDASYEGYPYTFTDSTGAVITLNSPPEKVAVLFSSYAEIWQLAGGEIAVTVGDSVERGFAEEGTFLVNDGPGMKIDMEALISQEPDFVIGSADMSAQAEACEQLNAIGTPAAAFTEECFEDYLELLKIFTDITGNQEAYETYGIDIQDEIQDILAKVEAIENKDTSILFIRAGSGYSSTKAKTAKDHFACIMLKELGTVNIADAAGALSEGLTLESIIDQQPDVVFIVPQGDETASKAYMDSLLSEKSWQGVNAVREGRYYYLSKDLFHYKPNHRWADAYELLAELLYPETFND